ncbi:DUF2867 domain-containing protein [Hanstruepera neustonica]|uniref:DUF2867 domain-containing protein n=1 Tax=Hanstruepera neustonica TaxID=1445657 RepID=A0A2K1DXK0_9FLAO|nr:SDR family oxidoreductase [Hanstruepera neustonica]PNQ72762.1 DUF2867 domain-containing protein [Hanstruepera neustonica]
MTVLLTGATGYIGKRLLPVLCDLGYHVVCGVRDVSRFNPPDFLKEQITTIHLDLLNEETLKNIPHDIEGAYYLVHSMSASEDYEELESQSARNFNKAIANTNIKHVIYLTGIVNENHLSKHLASRKRVEEILSEGKGHFTAIRAGIIIGSGSASFEIIRDLVEKLPIMITPRWLNTKCQPIGIFNVIQFLSKSLFNEQTYNQSFDIGGPDVLTYKEMLLEFARVRGLKRYIFTIPVMTPRLSSYWLYFVTSTSYRLAVALVNSMKIEVVCKDDRLSKLLDIQTLGYTECLQRTFSKIENSEIISSWKDAYVSSGMEYNISHYIQVPTFGCFVDKREKAFANRAETLERIWSIGGETGWYYGNWLWQIRGYLDKLVGGVGLRRGRTNVHTLNVGDALDFWRVLYANKEEGRLLLFAEMKLPGEAWLEFKVQDNKIVQTATFRPLGINGRLYWYSVWPFHGFIFKGMLEKLAS